MRPILLITTTTLAAVLALAPMASAKGRRGDYVSTSNEGGRRAQPGSVANPNPAYRAPEFGTSSGNPSRHEAPRLPKNAPNAASTRTNDNTGATNAAPAATPPATNAPSWAPAKPAAPNPTDPSEAPLPGMGADDPQTGQ